MTPKASPGVGAVSSTMEVDESPQSHCGRKPRVRREAATTTMVNGDRDLRINRFCDGKEEQPEVYETNCHWEGCGIEFITQDELVKVSNVT